MEWERNGKKIKSSNYHHSSCCSSLEWIVTWELFTLCSAGVCVNNDQINRHDARESNQNVCINNCEKVVEFCEKWVHSFWVSREFETSKIVYWFHLPSHISNPFFPACFSLSPALSFRVNANLTHKRSEDVNINFPFFKNYEISTRSEVTDHRPHWKELTILNLFDWVIFRIRTRTAHLRVSKLASD